LRRHSGFASRLRRGIASIAVLALALLGVSFAASASADPTPFSLSGTVTNLTSYPAGTATVAAGYYDPATDSYSYSSAVDVAADGTYSVDTTNGPGSYDLIFTVAEYSVPFLTTYYGGSVDEPRNGTAGMIDASAGSDLVGLDVALVPAGYITGTVSSGGIPLEDEDIEATDRTSDDAYYADAPTDVDGMYSMKVPAGDLMQVGEGSDFDYFPQFYHGHNFDPSDYDPVVVVAGGTTTGIDFDLIPFEGSVVLALIVGTPSDPAVALPGVHAELDVTDNDGTLLQSSKAVTGSSGLAIVSGSTPGNYTIIFTNAAGQRLAIHSVTYGVNHDPFFTPDTCSVYVGSLTQDDLEYEGIGEVDIELDSDLTICNGIPAAPTVPKHHHPLALSESVPTPTTTPTPTPAPTETPSASPSPSPGPSASSTPNPSPASAQGLMPWLVWLLIILAVIIIIGALAFILLRRR
jgi:hypothetical protein